MRAIWMTAILAPVCALAADVELRGGLERVTNESIVIRLANGIRVEAKLPKSGALASGAITTQFKPADEVQIICKPVDLNHCGALKGIRFLRPPTPKERALIVGSTPSASPPAAELERVRQVNLDRAKAIPSFVADEKARRYSTPETIAAATWTLRDTIESAITFKGAEPIRENIRINGKPWTKPDLPWINFNVDFGSEIQPVFDPECPTEIAFEGPLQVRGKQLLSFLYASPPDGCFGHTDAGNKRYNPGRLGRVLAEDPGGSMLQYEEQAAPFPAGYPLQYFRQVSYWDYVKIGETAHLLPVGLDFYIGYKAGGGAWVNVEYTNHRHFESATDIKFQP